jgi:phosphate starvation-inducible protein PhoH and related proteins
MRSGIGDVERLFIGMDDVGVVRLDESDVVRHPLVGRIVAAYNQLSREREA